MKLPLNKRILFVCIGSLIWIIFYKLFFIYKEPLFYKSDAIAEIFSTLLSSVIASGIFYYFVVYLEHRRIAKVLYPTINKRLGTFGVGLYFIKRELYHLKGLKIPDKIPDLEEFKKVCDDIILGTKAPEIIGNPSFSPANWYEYFDYYFQSDRALAEILLTHVAHLTPEILNELDEITYSGFQRALDVYRLNGRYDKLDGTVGPFWFYLTALEKLAYMKLK